MKDVQVDVCVLDAWHPEDPALVNSHWIAEQNIAALRRACPGAALVIISGADVDRASVEAELSKPHEGFVYLGHGREHVLYRCRDESGEPVPIVGIEQVRLLGDRWFHAFACLSGHTLCRDAANAGAGAYLGYRVAVTVEWDVPQLPDELRVLLEDLVTAATLELTLGQRSRSAIRRRVRDASDRLLDWLDSHEHAVEMLHWKDLTGLQMLASLLHQRLELEGTAVLP
ncbi:MAG TPA: hypothetical protein VLS89_18025 [Candidatus Nanopelagicales bacterium]|nr:hypothetical protein [Candidatus Nanopelagicales bacterium]